MKPKKKNIIETFTEAQRRQADKIVLASWDKIRKQMQI